MGPGNQRKTMENKLNKKLKTTIATEFGQTDTIDIEYSIRQGKPLSGPEFRLFIDQLSEQKDMESYIVT